MEKWLDEHPEFVHDYFARKARRSMVDGWLIAHALSHSGLSTGAPGDALSTSSTTSSNSKPSSGANTLSERSLPKSLRKVGFCVHRVHCGWHPDIPDLSPSSTPTRSSKPHRRSKSELKALDEKELMYELVIDICNDLDVTSLCYKILQNLSILLNADRCSLFLVQGKGTMKSPLCQNCLMLAVTPPMRRSVTERKRFASRGAQELLVMLLRQGRRSIFQMHIR